MILHFKDHGAVAPGGLLPICAMKSSASSENFYWANLNKTCRLFLFKDSSTLSMLNTESNKWVTLSKMSRNYYEVLEIPRTASNEQIAHA